MKVSEMTDDTLNRLIHEWMESTSFRCPHGLEKNEICVYCVASIPTYCQSLDAVAKAEAKVANPNSYALFEDTLLEVIRREHSKKDWQEYNNSYLTYLLIHATARQRAEAVAIAAGLEVTDA